MSNATVAALGLSIPIIVWAATMRAISGTWLHPGAFFALWWCFAGIIPILIAPEEYVSVGAVVWVFFAAIAMSLGAAAGNGGFKTLHLRAPIPPSQAELRLLSAILAAAVILGLASVLASVIEAGIPLSDIFNIQRIVIVANQMYVSQHVQVQETSRGVTQVLLPFVYLAPAIGGIVFVSRRRFIWRLLSLASLIPPLMVTVIQTTKAATLFSVTLWLCGYFGTRLRAGKLAVFTKPHLLLGVFLGVAGIGLFLATSLARVASTDVGLVGMAAGKLFGAAFGHMTVFSQWLRDYWSQPFSPTLGAFTFAGPLELAGAAKRTPGLFESLVELVTGDTSNIYTGFRHLIQDFTLPGAFAALAVTGFVGGVSFRKVANGNGRWLPLLMGTYATIMWTPITWFWVYNSLTATLVILGLIAFVIRKPRSNALHWSGSRNPIVST
ncbi:MAG TPA: oligosaccharide repeat unit polymerase [Gemmatimonadaceae bacterium]|nr:oligosaccharide repeat unit polymerase [Gemmatimonadaceae bacterium]